MNIVTIIQARSESSRLPNKVMLPLAGRPLLLRLVERVRAAKLVGQVVVATTTDPADTGISVLCWEEGIPCFRGHPTDLLDRHVAAGRHFGADAVVKIPSDCPLIDPAVVDRVIGHFLADPQRYDYVSNLYPPSYPDGNDVEIVSLAVLEQASAEADRDYEREHTTPFIWDRPERFRLGRVAWESGRDLSASHRWVVDYEADYHFVAAVYEALYPVRPLFTLQDILNLLEERPELMTINAHLVGVSWVKNYLSELRTLQPERG